ncbi:CAP domain-containing protein [Aliiroseovarius marinus]|uniref:CAP domain-containing protein n=1 Tax=Aliiroseovarius marinus TaxID=2500159 RepID=UPI003D7DD7C1
MKKKFGLPLLAAAALSVSLFAGQAHAACAVKHVPGSEKSISHKGLNQALLERAILANINAERCRRGLSPLASNAGLRKQAARHSAWMASARRLSHKATRGNRSLNARLKASGMRYRAGAENIGVMNVYNIHGRHFMIRAASSCNFTTTSGQRINKHSYASLARLATRLWMESPGHRKNILKRNVSYSGIGGAIQPAAAHCGEVFLTHIFAG